MRVSGGRFIAEWSCPLSTDIYLSGHFRPERFWAEIAISAVSASSIVIDFNIFEDGFSHVLSGREALPVNGFDFERMKEALGAGVVVTVTGAAHAAQRYA